MANDNKTSVAEAIRYYWSALFYGDRCYVRYNEPWEGDERDAYYCVEEQEDLSCLYWGPKISGIAPDKVVACSQLTAFIIDNLVSEGSLVETDLPGDQEDDWEEEDEDDL